MGICDECIIKDGCKFANSGLIMKHCKNFIGEAPREIKTNFQRISASPESLAEFISSLPVNVPPCEIYIRCHKCIYDKQCEKGSYPTDNEIWLAWLKQESDSE